MPNGAKHHLRGLTISSLEISLIFETRCLPVAIRGTFVRHSALRFLMGRCRQLWWIISWKIFSRLEEMEYLRLFFFFLSFLYIPCDLIDWLIDQLKMSPSREFCRSDLRERERERSSERTFWIGNEVEEHWTRGSDYLNTTEAEVYLRYYR